jgi:hypothetical protein
MLYFLFRCRRRLDARGFDQKSAIYQAVDKAYSAMHELHITLHYHACGRGVWRREEKRSVQAGHGSHSSTTEPSARLMQSPHRRDA